MMPFRSSTTLVLSLFPGIGLLDRAFEEQGFCVVRGPDALWGGDIKTFHPPPGRFDGVIGGPPCQMHSRLVHMVRHNGYDVAEDLIPEFERVVAEAKPEWFLMENAPASPVAVVRGYHVISFLLNNRWLIDTTPQNRLRRFSFGHRERAVNLAPLLSFSALEPVEYEAAVLATGSRGTPVKIGGSGKVKRLNKAGASNRSVADALALQGLPANFFGKKTPFTVAGQQRMIGNGVPLPMGRALAKAIVAALAQDAVSRAENERAL